MPGLSLVGRIAAISLLLGLPVFAPAQSAVTSPLSSDSNIAAVNPADVPFVAPAPVSLLAQTNEQQGDHLMVQKRYQAALDLYTKVEEPSASLWNKMGIAYQMLFDPKNATRCYKQSLGIDPRHFGALNNLATIEDARRNFTAAERLYRKALEINPHSALTLKNLGTNLAMQHRNTESSAAFAQALAADPHILDQYSGPTATTRVPIKDRGEASYLKARSCALAGLNDCALTHLRRAFDEGSATTKQVADDSDFEALRGTPGFERLLAQQQ